MRSARRPGWTADLEVAAVGERTGADQIAEAVVVGTILGESMLAALRLLAQEDASSRQLTGTTKDPAPQRGAPRIRRSTAS